MGEYIEVLHEGARPKTTLHIYSGAQHGFYNALRNVSYDEAVSALARTRSLAMLQDALGR